MENIGGITCLSGLLYLQNNDGRLRKYVREEQSSEPAIAASIQNGPWMPV